MHYMNLNKAQLEHKKNKNCRFFHSSTCKTLTVGTVLQRFNQNFRREQDRRVGNGHRLPYCDYTRTMPITIPYLNTLPNTLGFCPELKSCRQPIRIEHEKHVKLVSQSESSVT